MAIPGFTALPPAAGLAAILARAIDEPQQGLLGSAATRSAALASSWVSVPLPSASARKKTAADQRRGWRRRWPPSARSGRRCSRQPA